MSNIQVQSDLLESVISPFTRFHRKQGRNVLQQALNFSSYSNAGYSGSFYPPSSSCLIDRRFLVNAVVRVSTSVNDELLQGAPRSFPLSTVMQSCSIGINGNVTTSSPRDILWFMERCNVDSVFRSKYWSLTPSYPDPVSSYGKCPKWAYQYIQARDTANGGGAVIANNFATSAQPIVWSPFVDQAYFKSDAECSRAAFPRKTVNAQYHDYDICEPLLHPLCCDNEELGLSNVRELTLNLTFDSSLGKLYSSPTAITDLAVNLVQEPPKLLITYVEPDNPNDIPLEISIPYTQHLVKNVQCGTLAVGLSEDVSFSNIILGQVPDKLYIFAHMRESARSYRYANGFSSVNKLNLTVGNRSGLLGSMTDKQLYQMSVRNGLCMTWLEWSKRIGSIVIIDVAKDIGGLMPGAIGNVSISFTVNHTNRQYADPGEVDTGANTISYDCFCVAELSGEYKISQDTASLSLGLTVSDALEAENNEPIVLSSEPEAQGKGFYTGGSMAGWRKFLRGVRRNLNKVNNFAQKVAPSMATNPYLSGAAKILGSVTDTANNLEIGKEGSGMRAGRGLLRM